MARVKTEQTPPNSTALEMANAFDALMATAMVDSQIYALLESESDTRTLNTALTGALNTALQRWGLGLHHLKHAAKWQNDNITFITDNKAITHMSDGAAALAAAYAPMQSLDERNLSMWGVLPEGHRSGADINKAQLKVLIEEARDFETHWHHGRGQLFHRIWRKADHLHIEVSRPASADTALTDAAWDVIASIKDRSFQRELMKRSEKLGMLGALLGARHEEAKANLERLPEAHFSVQAVVYVLKGSEGRDMDNYRQQLKHANAELEEYQQMVTKQLSEVLRYGLKK